MSAFADKVILEINDISELENQDQIIYGMLPAGSEETIVEQLKKQGSLKLEEPIDVEMDWRRRATATKSLLSVVIKISQKA